MKYNAHILAGLMLCLLVAAVPTASADWPMFQGSLNKSGFYNGTLPADNATMWTQQTGLWIVNAPAIVDGVAYYGAYDYHVYAVDVRNGEVIWKTPLDWIVVQSSPAVDLDNGLVYVASLNKFFALNLTTGDVEWWFRNQGNFMVSGWPEVGCPAIYNDYVYYGSVDGYLYKFPARDPNGDGEMELGEAEWSFRSGDILPDSEGIFYAPVTVAVRNGT
ncbi:MAG: PQQ-binding-like beta-propeller repeat protein, partial [Thermoplasmata archaeon]|nr:PQQ-binding-like beta-propeller repeat protein [Thermoplasmata archaeon]